MDHHCKPFNPKDFFAVEIGNLHLFERVLNEGSDVGDGHQVVLFAEEIEQGVLFEVVSLHMLLELVDNILDLLDKGLELVYFNQLLEGLVLFPDV